MTRFGVTKIISGGQTGVDRAALDAAEEIGVDRGGACPRGRRAEDGMIPLRYPLTETVSSDYMVRTRTNIETAHATLVLARAADHSLLTGGTRRTFDLAHRLGRSRGAGLYLADLAADGVVDDCRLWLRECTLNRDRFTLNVAGPRESKEPGIYEAARTFLRRLFAGGANIGGGRHDG